MVSKFIVVLQICSILSGECSDWHTDNIKKDTIKDCLKHGYQKSIDIIDNLQEEYILETKTAIRFVCEAVKINDT
jgi:predicted transcriptional regulator YheO